MEPMFSEYEYWGKDMVQTSKMRTYKQEILPLSALQRNANIEFYFAGEQNHYIDMAKSDIRLRVKITKTAGAVLAAADKVGPINSPLDSLISNLEITLGGKIISDQNYMYPWRANFEDLLSQNTEMQNSQLQAKLWFKDTAGAHTTFETASTGANKGLVERAKFFAESKTVDLVGRLHGDIFLQPLAIPSGVSLKIRITPTTDTFVLVTPAPAANGTQLAAQVEILSAVLRLQIVEVSSEFEAAQQRAVRQVNQRIPIKHVTMKHLTIPTGQSAVQQENVYLGHLPEVIVMAMVSEAAMSGGYQQNPFHYQDFGLNYLALHVNGQMVPCPAYTPDFANKNYINEYMSLFDMLGLAYSGKTITISRDEYVNGYTLFVFDLTADKNGSHSVSPPSTGSVRIEMKFAAATTAPIKIILYGSRKSFIEIDKFRNVIVPF